MEKGPALPKNIRQIGEISGREKVCIEDYVMTWIHKREQQEDKGYLGIFFGERQETEDSVYVFIRGVFEVPAQIQEAQEREALQKEYEKYFGDWTVQGCCVIGIYPTERMKTLGTWIPEAGKLIYHLQDQEETIYWTGEEQYRRLRGYFVFYEQNRKMQEYLAEVFSDNSVEKESAPDRAIRSFREKVKEKGEQRQNNFLRIASSFFVITVLIIGAIVVNRIEDIREIRNLPSAEEVSVYQPQAEVESDSDDNVAEAESTINASANQDAAAMSTAQYNAVQQAAEEATLTGSDAFWEESDLEDASEQPQEESESSEIQADSTAGLAAPESQFAAADATQMTTENSASDQKDAQEAIAVRHTQAGYVIKEGDTLAKICSQYYGSIDRIEEVCEANGIEDANVILPGQRIVLP